MTDRDMVKAEIALNEREIERRNQEFRKMVEEDSGEKKKNADDQRWYDAVKKG